MRRTGARALDTAFRQTVGLAISVRAYVPTYIIPTKDMPQCHFKDFAESSGKAINT